MRNRMRALTRGILPAALVLAAAPHSFGQAVYGSIIGTVLDASGAAIPNASVVVTDAAKGTSVTVMTNGSGEFTADHLTPDSYNVKINFTGFKTFETQGLDISADTSRKLEAVLQPGATGETIEVNASEVPQLKADRADVSTNFGAKELEDLPISDRNFTALQLLLPGAQQLGWSHAADENPQGSRQIQVDGQAFGGVAFELDGTDNQDPILGIIVINPNIDSLQESKITTQNFDAEFGKAVSSVVTAQTKSGTNAFHGSGFDYYQDNALHATDPFSQPKTNSPVIAPSTRNQFGGSLGGPILKDKVFFFGDYQGVRQSVGSSITATVPTAHLISTCLGQAAPFAGNVAGCDFSEYKTPIFNPTTHLAYPNYVIPAAQVSVPALNVFKLLQPYAPNNFTNAVLPFPTATTGTIAGLESNYSASGSGSLNTDQWDARADYQASARVHAFGRFSRFTDTLTGATAFGAIGGPGFGIGGYGGTSKGANDSLALGTDYVITPKLVLDVRLGYYRYNIITAKYDGTTPLATQLGIPGENTNDPITGGAPFFNITEFGSPQANPNNGSPNGAGAPTGPQYGGGLNVTRCNCPLKEREDQGQVVSNLTKTVGNHSVKFGGDIRYARNLRVPSDNDRTGINQFNSLYTSDGLGQGNNGLGLATFALGEVTAFNRYVSTSTNAKEFQKRDFFYAQDTWRASEKLTLNLGLRYEFYFPETINSPGEGAILNLSTGYLQVAGTGGIASNMNFSPGKNAYNPRIGVAYQARPSTVIRAGYGRSFDIGVFGSIFGHVATQNLPVLANQQINPTSGPNSGAFNLATGPSAPTFVSVPANGLLPSPGYAVNSKSRPTTLRLPTIDAWNLSLQQSVTPTLSFTIAYVGNKGTHTLSAGDGNSTNPNEAAINLPATYSVTGQALHYDPSVASTDVSGVPAGLGLLGITGINANGGTSNQTYLRRYFGGKLPACSNAAYAVGVSTGVPAGSCGWSNDVTYYGDDQDTHYNALQTTMTKTFNRHFSFNANYAWQRSINFASGYATWLKQAGKGRDDSTREQQLVAYGLFRLPFGRNEYFFGKSNRLVQALIGGYQLSPVANYSSGLPYTLTNGSCLTPSDVPCYAQGNRFAYSGSISGYAGGTGTNALTFHNNAAPGTFTSPGLDQIGNVGRNTATGPRFFNTDLALQKDITFREHYTTQLRVDAYNVFNHINFGNPSGNTSSTTSSLGSEPGGAQPRYLQLSARFQF